MNASPDDVCDHCFHERSHHGDEGCEHERDVQVPEVGPVAVRCGCPTFVEPGSYVPVPRTLHVHWLTALGFLESGDRVDLRGRTRSDIDRAADDAGCFGYRIQLDGGTQTCIKLGGEWVVL